MSLLGKILALLNLFGAVGLVYVAMLDYGKRQAWAHSYFRHEIVLNGLPLPPEQRDAVNPQTDDRISEDMAREMFGQVGGNPVTTQVQEVERVQGILDGKLQAAQSKPAQSYLLSRILMGLADNYLEREQLLACRAHFASDASLKALETRYEAAFREAQRPLPEGLPENAKTFADSFRLAFRYQGGEPADYFTSLVLQKLLDKDGKPTAKLPDAISGAIETQRAALEARYQQLFSDAKGTSDKALSRTPTSTTAQQAAIARLLFGLSPFLAEEDILTDESKADLKRLLAGPADRSGYQNALFESEPYRVNVRRTYVVCGLRASLEAIGERAAVLRNLGSYVQQSFGQERLQFVFDHAAIIEQLREYAGIVREEQLRIGVNKKKLSDHEEIVRLRTKEIEDLSADLAKSRAETAVEIDKLRKLSENVLGLRVKVRDAIRDNEIGEKRIRELETKIQTLEK